MNPRLSTALLIGFVLSSCGAAQQPAQDPPAAVTVSPPPAPSAPTSSPAPAPSQLPADKPKPDRITGLEECDEYLALYKRCEKRLEPEILAGNRRFYSAEEGWLKHLLNGPERPALKDSCTSMLTALRSSCQGL